MRSWRGKSRRVQLSFFFKITVHGEATEEVNERRRGRRAIEQVVKRSKVTKSDEERKSKRRQAKVNEPGSATRGTRRKATPSGQLGRLWVVGSLAQGSLGSCHFSPWCWEQGGQPWAAVWTSRSIRTFLGVEGVHWDGGRLATVGRNGQLQGFNPATSPGSGRRGLKISLPLRGAHHTFCLHRVIQAQAQHVILATLPSPQGRISNPDSTPSLTRLALKKPTSLHRSRRHRDIGAPDLSRAIVHHTQPTGQFRRPPRRQS